MSASHHPYDPTTESKSDSDLDLTQLPAPLLTIITGYLYDELINITSVFPKPIMVPYQKSLQRLVFPLLTNPMLKMMYENFGTYFSSHQNQSASSIASRLIDDALNVLNPTPQSKIEYLARFLKKGTDESTLDLIQSPYTQPMNRLINSVRHIENHHNDANTGLNPLSNYLDQLIEKEFYGLVRSTITNAFHDRSPHQEESLLSPKERFEISLLRYTTILPGSEPEKPEESYFRLTAFGFLLIISSAILEHNKNWITDGTDKESFYCGLMASSIFLSGFLALLVPLYKLLSPKSSSFKEFITVGSGLYIFGSALQDIAKLDSDNAITPLPSLSIVKSIPSKEQQIAIKDKLVALSEQKEWVTDASNGFVAYLPVKKIQESLDLIEKLNNTKALKASFKTSNVKEYEAVVMVSDVNFEKLMSCDVSSGYEMKSEDLSLTR